MKHLDDYQKEKLAIDLVKANVFALLLIIPTVLLFGINPGIINFPPVSI